MCHHYDSENIADWEREFETEEDETPEDDPEPEFDDKREPVTPHADD